jgi:hypothetical protein
MNIASNLILLTSVLWIIPAGNHAQGLVGGLVIGGVASAATLGIASLFSRGYGKMKQGVRNIHFRITRADIPLASELTDNPDVSDPFLFRTGGPPAASQEKGAIIVALEDFARYGHVLNKAILKVPKRFQVLLKRMWLYFTYRCQQIMACSVVEEEQKTGCLDLGVNQLRGDELKQRQKLMSAFIQTLNAIVKVQGIEYEDQLMKMMEYFRQRFEQLKEGTSAPRETDQQKIADDGAKLFDEPVLLV